ncbi:hypothetical protein AA14337_2926 [Acetobacter malorum DSM 14337]|uniref:Uncharacterized protein n=2 Tax=Acetobacter malorum TaxID=178901 RepID=A0ABQ0PYL7_9PROT|nr:hypothetical protein AA14337_2926 [Acetobacter malorum DSM 14337]
MTEMQARDFETVAELRDAFPSAFMVDGTLNLSGQSGIRTLPRNMIVEGDLRFDGCSDLLETPDGLEVMGSMRGGRCNSLVRIGQANVRQDLSIARCDSLDEISPDVAVGGLILFHCANLEYISPAVRVRGSVSLSYCTGLNAVPWEEIKGYFNAVGCTGLNDLPSQFSVESFIDISSTHGLELRDDVICGRIIARRCKDLKVSEGLVARLSGDIDLTGSEYTLTAPPTEEFSPGPA